MSHPARKPAPRRALHPRDITDAERRVLEPLSEGLCAKQIGVQLGLAENTVKSHLTRISRRWNVQGRQALLVAAYQRGELPLPEGPELLVLRSALLEIARLVGTSVQSDGLDPEVVIPALRARLAADAGMTVRLPPDWRTQVESYPTWAADNVIELVEEWQDQT